jgi:hypothetical protein
MPQLGGYFRVDGWRSLAVPAELAARFGLRGLPVGPGLQPLPAAPGRVGLAAPAAAPGPPPPTGCA